MRLRSAVGVNSLMAPLEMHTYGHPSAGPPLHQPRGCSLTSPGARQNDARSDRTAWSRSCSSIIGSTEGDFFMRYTRIGLAILAFTTTLVAADPFVGTWKLNTSKTKFKTGSAPKDQTVTIMESGGDLDIAVK